MKAGDDCTFYHLPILISTGSFIGGLQFTLHKRHSGFSYNLTSDLKQETASLHFIFIQRTKVNTTWQTVCCHPKRCSKP